MSEEVDHRNNHERKREIPFHTPAKSQKLEGKKKTVSSDSEKGNRKRRRVVGNEI